MARRTLVGSHERLEQIIVMCKAPSQVVKRAYLTFSAVSTWANAGGTPLWLKRAYLTFLSRFYLDGSRSLSLVFILMYKTCSPDGEMRVFCPFVPFPSGRNARGSSFCLRVVVKHYIAFNQFHNCIVFNLFTREEII